MKNTKIIILAGGKGTRLNNGSPTPIPKVLVPLGGRPMIGYILETLKKIKAERPILVIGYKGELIKDEFGNSCEYANQTKRLGTGHAARLGIKKVSDGYQYIMILQGDDSAFYTPELIEGFVKNHIKKDATISLMTTSLDDVKDLGRVIKDSKGNVLKIVEKEYMTEELQKIKEINCGAYVINSSWAKKNISKIKKHLKGGKEYPLTDIVPMAINQGKKVISYNIDSKYWIGVNTKEQLGKAEKKLKSLTQIFTTNTHK